MGWNLCREVRFFAPATLTHREKLAAMVLADDADEDTRTTYSSVLDPEIMTQVMVSSDRQMLAVVAELRRKKVVEHVGGGHNGREAKFRFLPLAPVGWSPTRPRAATLPVDHGGLAVKGDGIRQATRPKGDGIRHPTARSSGGKGDGIRQASDAEGCRNPGGRVTESGNAPSSPHPSLTKNSSSSVPARTHAALVAAGIRDEEEEIYIQEIKNSTDARGRKIGMPFRYIDTLDANGDLPADIAAKRAARALRATQTPETAPTALTPHCGDCGDPAATPNPAVGNWRFRTHNGLPTGRPCPACHPHHRQETA